MFPPETEKGMVIFLQKGHFQHAAFHEEGKVILKHTAFHKEGKDILKHLQYTLYSKIWLLRPPKIKTISTLKAD